MGHGCVGNRWSGAADTLACRIVEGGLMGVLVAVLRCSLIVIQRQLHFQQPFGGPLLEPNGCRVVVGLAHRDREGDSEHDEDEGGDREDGPRQLAAHPAGSTFSSKR